MTSGKNSFILYVNFGKQVRMLTMKERGELLTAIFDYAEYGMVEGKLTPRTAMAFSIISDTIDRDREAYEARCEQNRARGKRGGRPRKNFVPEDDDIGDQKTEWFSEKPEKADNDNENDKENDNDSDNENENGKENDRDTGAEPRGRPPQGTPCSPTSAFSEDFGEAEYLSLIYEGIPGSYIRTHEDRAREYARHYGVSVANVLREWYLKDAPKKARKKEEPPRPPVGELGNSFDEDDFFNAALRYSLSGKWLEGNNKA